MEWNGAAAAAAASDRKKFVKSLAAYAWQAEERMRLRSLALEPPFSTRPPLPARARASEAALCIHSPCELSKDIPLRHRGRPILQELLNGSLQAFAPAHLRMKD